MDKELTRIEFLKVTYVLGEAFRTLSENAKHMNIKGPSVTNAVCIALSEGMFPIIEERWAEYQLLKKQFEELIDELRYKRRTQDEAN